MSQQNVELVCDQYAAVNERDFARAMSHYAEDVELVVPSGIRGGIFNGRVAVGGWFGDWFSTFAADARFDIESTLDIDESRVLLIAQHHARGRASGAEIEGEVVWLYELRDGKIAHVRGYDSRAEAFRALGLDE